MSSKGSYIRYILYFAVILFLLVIGGKMTANYYNDLVDFNELSFIRQTLINLLSYGGVGIVLGMESLIKENRKDGKWRFNYKKMIVIGIPALVLSLPMIWGIIIIICLNGKVNDNVMTIYNFMTIFNVIFGYILITSIYREEERRILEFRNLININ